MPVALIRRLVPALIAVAAWGGLTATAGAQPAGDPYLPQGGFSSAPSNYWGYTYVPYGNTILHGAAAVIEAQGDFLVKREQAARMREDLRRERLKTRRAVLEHLEWERDFFAGDLNRRRERLRKNELDRNLIDPPLTEVWSGNALNSLYTELSEKPGLSENGSTPIEPEWLQHVNITVTGGGNVGPVKKKKIFWPVLLRNRLFKENTEAIDKCFALMQRQLTSEERSLEALEQLRKCLDDCEQKLNRGIRTGDTFRFNSRHAVDARRCLGELQEALAILEKPENAYLFQTIQARNVAELVRYMKKNGIRFGPATTSDQRFYVALRGAMADDVKRLRAQQP
jgi:hypothetical protein